MRKKKKERKKEDDEIRLFRRSVSQLPRVLKGTYICELLGSIILSACLVWGL